MQLANQPLPTFEKLLIIYHPIAALTSLELSAVNLQNADATQLGILIPRMGRLAHLDISWNGISLTGFFDLTKAFPWSTIKSFNCSGNSLEGLHQGNLSFLSASKIEELQLSSCEIGDAELKALAPYLNNVKKLNVANNKFADIGVKCLAMQLQQPSNKMEFLNLKYNPITAFAEIELIRAEILRLAAIQTVPGPKLQIIGSKFLEFNRAVTKDKAKITSLDLSYETIGRQGVACLQSWLTGQLLQVLNLRGCGITTEEFEVLSNILLPITGTKFSSKQTQLRFLDVGMNNLGDGAIKPITRLILGLPLLKLLKIDLNEFTDVSAIAICGALVNSSSLEELCIYPNPLNMIISLEYFQYVVDKMFSLGRKITFTNMARAHTSTTNVSQTKEVKIFAGGPPYSSSAATAASSSSTFSSVSPSSNPAHTSSALAGAVATYGDQQLPWSIFFAMWSHQIKLLSQNNELHRLDANVKTPRFFIGGVSHGAIRNQSQRDSGAVNSVVKKEARDNHFATVQKETASKVVQVKAHDNAETAHNAIKKEDHVKPVVVRRAAKEIAELFRHHGHDSGSPQVEVIWNVSESTAEPDDDCQSLHLHTCTPANRGGSGLS